MRVGASVPLYLKSAVQTLINYRHRERLRMCSRRHAVSEPGAALGRSCTACGAQTTSALQQPLGWQLRGGGPKR